MKFLIGAKYSPDTDNPTYTFFCSESHQLEELKIPREDSYSYFLQRNMTPQQVYDTMRDINEKEGKGELAVSKIVDIEMVNRYNVFEEEWEKVAKVNMETANDVRDFRFTTCHEGHIRRITRHMIDKQWYMGMPYDDEYNLISTDIDKKYREQLIKEGYPEEVIIQMLQWMFTDIPDISCVSFDIETEQHGTLQPNATYAATPIISAAFKFNRVDDESRKPLVVMLSNNLRKMDNHKPPNAMFRELVKGGTIDLEIFETEYDLVMRIIEVLNDDDYPLCLTYYGEGFDLPYLYNRAINLGINTRRIPFHAYISQYNKSKRGIVNWRCKFDNKMHIDLYQFFKQPVVQNYIFKNKYDRLGLDDVAKAIIGRGKIDHDENIDEMSFSDLGYYNFVDADITMELLTNDDFLILKIVFMFMRIGRQDYYEAAHRAIGNKILNLFQGYMTERDMLIPNAADMEAIGTAHSNPDIEGKGYRGAIVIIYIMAVLLNVQTLDFGCFPTDTEILTENGWKGLQDIKNKPQELIATVNKDTKLIEYQHQTMIHEYQYDGNMFHYEVTGGLDLLVTPNHRIVYRKRNRKGGRKPINASLTWEDEWSIEEAQNLNRYWYSIPHFGRWKGEKKNITIGEFEFTPEQFLPFFGWFLSDGTIDSKRISISQKKNNNVASIKKSLDVLGVKYSYGEYNEEHIFTIKNIKLCTSMLKWMNNKRLSHEKHIPRNILNLDINSLRLLFDTMISGDGSYCIRMGKKLPRYYASTSIQLISDFQEVALRLGYGCAIRKEERTTNFYGQKYEVVCYVADLSYTRKNVINGQRPVKEVPFKGTVWCVTVPNGTIIVRRNGKVCVTGNSLYPSIMRSRNISFETINCKHQECKSNRVPELPHHVCTKKTGILPILIGCLKDIRLFLFKPWSKNKSLSKKDRNTYKAIEQAIKVFVNAAYGVFAHGGFGLRCLPVAESITAWSRDAITRLVVEAEKLNGNDLLAIADEYGIEPLDAISRIPPDQRAVCGGDTDSIHARGFTDKERQHLIEFAENELNVVLEPEKPSIIMVSYKKKNYMKITRDGEVIVKGMLGKKRNTPNISVKCFNEFKTLLKSVAESDNIDLDRLRRETISLTKKYYDMIWRGEGNLEDYAIEVTMTKSFDEYKSEPQHVKAAKKWVKYIQNEYIALKTAPPDAIVPPGSQVQFIKSAATPKRKLYGRSSSITCDPIPIQLATREDITPEYYHDSLLSVMSQIMETMDIDESEVITLEPSQQTLDVFI